MFSFINLALLVDLWSETEFLILAFMVILFISHINLKIVFWICPTRWTNLSIKDTNMKLLLILWNLFLEIKILSFLFSYLTKIKLVYYIVFCTTSMFIRAEFDVVTLNSVKEQINWTYYDRFMNFNSNCTDNVGDLVNLYTHWASIQKNASIHQLNCLLFVFVAWFLGVCWRWIVCSINWFLSLFCLFYLFSSLTKQVGGWFGLMKTGLTPPQVVCACPKSWNCFGLWCVFVPLLLLFHLIYCRLCMNLDLASLISGYLGLQDGCALHLLKTWFWPPSIEIYSYSRL